LLLVLKHENTIPNIGIIQIIITQQLVKALLSIKAVKKRVTSDLKFLKEK